MNIISLLAQLGIGLTVIYLAILLGQHTHHWIGKSGKYESGDRDHLIRQIRRRRQANFLLALVGVAILVGSFLPPSMLMLIYWCGVALVVFWVLGLACADFWQSHRYFRSAWQEQQRERERLEEDLQRRRQLHRDRVEDS